jgi:hypothetical protein
LKRKVTQFLVEFGTKVFQIKKNEKRFLIQHRLEDLTIDTTPFGRFKTFQTVDYQRFRIFILLFCAQNAEEPEQLMLIAK